jgi:hypothetical protein
MKIYRIDELKTYRPDVYEGCYKWIYEHVKLIDIKDGIVSENGYTEIYKKRKHSNIFVSKDSILRNWKYMGKCDYNINYLDNHELIYDEIMYYKLSRYFPNIQIYSPKSVIHYV